MSSTEVAAHVRKKWRQRVDAHRGWIPPKIELSQGRGFPLLPDPTEAPAAYFHHVCKEAEDILSGRWVAFGELPLQVDDPPNWQKDYLVGCDLGADRLAFSLNHRMLPGGADSKLIWELSRWSTLVRLAQASWLTEDEQAGRTCIRWLQDWTTHNVPWRGWNWTSALESGLRLVQLTWLDALLGAPESPWASAWARLRSELLPAHVWFTWRYQSCGSSANNHLLGEVAGVLMAVARWPELANWAVPLDRLQSLWEIETLAQFAEDGGNREQALNYHLFSFEFCWQARAALLACGRKVSSAVEDRLQRAAEFFLAVQEPAEPWDYGDSDNAYVTPLFRSERTVAQEWADWFQGNRTQPLSFWLGAFPFTVRVPKTEGWLHFPKSGLAVRREADWFLRLDVSPLGYLATAAHGHLDALHLSLWHRGLAWVIDPGTGAYYADPPLRNHLAGRTAHNGPDPEGVQLVERLGPFLWGPAHAVPQWRQLPGQTAQAELFFKGGRLRRRVESYRQADQCRWRVMDECLMDKGEGRRFTVRWQFAPDTAVEVKSKNHFRVSRHGTFLDITIGSEWASHEWITQLNPQDWRGTVSPRFRSRVFAPCLELTASAQQQSFTTEFEIAIGLVGMGGSG